MRKTQSYIAKLWKRYVHGAKVRGLNFKLSFDHFAKLVQSNCAYCGIEPSQIIHVGKYEFKYNGVDRILNDHGYEDWNVKPCCGMCNMMKKTLHTKDFLEHVLRIAKQTELDNQKQFISILEQIKEVMKEKNEN